MRWLEGTTVPGVPVEEVTHQHLLRSMDRLENRSDALEATLAGRLGPLIDQDLSIVCYDLTTLRVEGQPVVEADLRRYGLSKQGDIARQCLLGIVQTADGLPIYHEVFAANTAETTTLALTIEGLWLRFPIRRGCWWPIADCCLWTTWKSCKRSRSAITLWNLSSPGRRYGEFAELPRDFQDNTCASAQQEVIGETPWQGLRLVMAHHPTLAAERLPPATTKSKSSNSRRKPGPANSTGQDTGTRYRGRKLSDGGVMARFHQAVSDAKLSRIIKIDLSSPLFTYDIDAKALALARRMDGKLLLATNVPDLAPEEIVARYKALADIERGFRALKSEIKIAPVYHRLPQRIRAHALICFLALGLYRVPPSSWMPTQPIEPVRELLGREPGSAMSRCPFAAPSTLGCRAPTLVNLVFTFLIA